VAQAVRKSAKAEEQAHPLARRLREAGLILATALSLFLVIALVSFHPNDPGWSHTGSGDAIHNQGGVVGAWLADILLYLFGNLAYLFPVMLGFSAWRLLRARSGAVDYFHLTTRAIGLLLFVGAGCGLAWLYFHSGLPHSAGGVLGDLVGAGAVRLLSSSGGTLFLLALLLIGITLYTGLSWLSVMDITGDYTLRLWEWSSEWAQWLAETARGRRARREREASVRSQQQRKRSRPKPKIEPRISTLEIGERAEQERQHNLFQAQAGGVLPPLGLLDPPRSGDGAYTEEVLEAMSRQVELKLRDFGVEVEVVAVHPGPVITRFEVQPAPGVKVNQISNLSKDLARALSTVSVRVVDIIPGKTVIGLEIPNEYRELVALSEILNSKGFQSSSSPLTLGLGKDIGGAPVVVDLARMPHLLVAGTTGSGKSVALNAMILSLLYKAEIDAVRLILIDPKMLELSVYEGIPGLLTPVVTDMKEAANALRWCVAEMERRYQLMAALGVRNISGYNRKVREAADKGKPIPDPFAQRLDEDTPPPGLEPLPFVVVVVDELADMMMTVGKKVEELIARLAQKARAAGIHLILATQRPSVDVITGLIKANIPCRIAFQVSSKVDSRTILDQMGAEALLGHGDMLYLAAGTGLPTRVHGAFVSDQEVHRVVEFLKQSGTPDYNEEVLEGPAEQAAEDFFGMDSGDDIDELYDQAVRIVTETRRASISGVQRRLKIGYNRAARMIEEMERSGIVGELQSNGSREVLAPPPPED
jgi:S-DNA-T family DNA segregation ATPase FtsK/SpoIIIE